LTEEQATRANIVAKFQQFLIEPAQPGDTVVFSFSGHGQRIADPTGYDGLRASFVPFDYRTQSATDGAATNLRSDQLRDLLATLKGRMTREGQVVGEIAVVLDACFSGGGTKDAGVDVRKGRDWDPALDGPDPRGSATAPGARPMGILGEFDAGKSLAQGYVLLAACPYDDVALASPTLGAGVFTYHLTAELARATPQTTYQGLFERVRARLYGRQRPQLEGNVTHRVLQGQATPAESYYLVTAVDGPTVTLSVGALLGASSGSRFALFRPGTSVREYSNEVAEVELEHVGPTSSRARLLPGLLTAERSQELLSARAVETAHDYSAHRLRAWLARFPAGSVPDLPPMVTTAGASQRDHDVLIRRETGRVRVLLPNGTVIADLPDGPERDKRLGEALLGAWRWMFVSRHLIRDDPASSVRIEMDTFPVDVEQNDRGEVVRIKGPRPGAKAGGPRIFHQGDSAVVLLRNYSRAPAYVTVLDLAPDGSLNLIYPPAAGPAVDNYQPIRVEPDNQWHQIPDLVLRATPPFGREQFKAIATVVPVDFRTLMFQPLEGGAKSPMKAIPIRLHPLALLLRTAQTGTKDEPTFRLRTDDDWATAEVFFEVTP
jgi:hypothetical protein